MWGLPPLLAVPAATVVVAVAVVAAAAAAVAAAAATAVAAEQRGLICGDPPAAAAISAAVVALVVASAPLVVAAVHAAVAVPVAAQRRSLLLLPGATSATAWQQRLAAVAVAAGRLGMPCAEPYWLPLGQAAVLLGQWDGLAHVPADWRAATCAGTAAGGRQHQGAAVGLDCLPKATAELQSNNGRPMSSAPMESLRRSWLSQAALDELIHSHSKVAVL